MNPHKLFVFSIAVMLFIVLSACGPENAAEVEIETAWEVSAHNDLDSRSFTRWDEDQPPEIPIDCAKCHSTPGYLNHIGADSSTPGQVDRPVPTGTTIECEACHNEVAESKGFATMPSGLEITSLGQESNCLECHQGLASSLQVAEMIADHPADMVNTDLSMPDIHANAAGATFYGSQAKGGGEYPQYKFESKFYHGFDTCATCHDPHTLQVRVDQCSACHLGATTLDGVKNIRLSRIDYDGDGDISEGLAGEIETMMEKLLVTIRLYAALTDGAELINYDGKFLNQAGEDYTTWTPSLLQAAYNYHYTAIDPGSYSHNPKYIMQLLYDSIDDLGGSTRGMTRPNPVK
jgi:hypothetical protein